ncbi:MAG: large subunit ribosomal protein L35, partial [Myxococcota bacterium]
MPKMKTHSGAKKRFSLTGTGKVKFKRAKMRHILTKKNAKLRRNLRKASTL